ncbi:hypothetical protein J6590_097837 [Homalodisca vitripennis]|nr:hypothetical protein J6590_097837 [Homalodisca vitripennis]
MLMLSCLSVQSYKALKAQGPRAQLFSSPNIPGFYPRDTECHYFFHGDTNQRVRLHFHYFDVEGVLP